MACRRALSRRSAGFRIRWIRPRAGRRSCRRGTSGGRWAGRSCIRVTGSQRAFSSCTRLWAAWRRAAYGSLEYSVANPAKKGHDTVEVKSAKLQADGRTVFLEIPGLGPVMQMGITYKLKAAGGADVEGAIYNTINRGK